MIVIRIVAVMFSIIIVALSYFNICFVFNDIWKVHVFGLVIF